MTLLGTPYNYGSVMHYGAYSAAIDRNIPTIIPLDSSAEIGQRITLSTIDIERVQIHYGCIDPVKINTPSFFLYERMLNFIYQCLNTTVIRQWSTLLLDRHVMVFCLVA